MTVLLVEDHTDTRSVLGMLLNRCGYQTVTAKSLKEARTRYRTKDTAAKEASRHVRFPQSCARQSRLFACFSHKTVYGA